MEAQLHPAVRSGLICKCLYFVELKNGQDLISQESPRPRCLESGLYLSFGSRSLFIYLVPFLNKRRPFFPLHPRSSFHWCLFAKWLHYLRRDSASRSTKAFWKRSLFSGNSGKWKMLLPEGHTSVLYEPHFSSEGVTLWPSYQQKQQSGAVFFRHYCRLR